MSSVCHGLAYISTDFTGDSPSRLPFRAWTSRLTDRQDATENSSQSIYQLSPTTENIVLFKSYCPHRHRTQEMSKSQDNIGLVTTELWFRFRSRGYGLVQHNWQTHTDRLDRSTRTTVRQSYRRGAGVQTRLVLYDVHTHTHTPARPLYQDYCKTVVPAWCWCAGEACTVRRMTGSIRCWTTTKTSAARLATTTPTLLSDHSAGRQHGPSLHIHKPVSVAEWLARLTAVWEDPGSNHAAGSCVYRDSRCDLQPWIRAAHLYCNAYRSTQPSTLRRRVKWVSAYGLSNNNNSNSAVLS